MSKVSDCSVQPPRCTAESILKLLKQAHHDVHNLKREAESGSHNQGVSINRKWGTSGKRHNLSWHCMKTRIQKRPFNFIQHTAIRPSATGYKNTEQHENQMSSYFKKLLLDSDMGGTFPWFVPDISPRAVAKYRNKSHKASKWELEVKWHA